MIFDSTFLFSDDQAITATTNSTNAVDLGVVRDIGKGVPVSLHVQVTEDFATLTSLAVTVETSEFEDFAVSEDLLSSAAVEVADLVEGYQFPVQYMPKGIQRYVRLAYTVSGSNATAGKVTAGISDA